MKAKKLFPDVSFKRLLDKIKELENKVGDGSDINLGELNKNLTVRYNSETDKIQCLFNGVWHNVMTAFIQSYLFKNTDFTCYGYKASSDTSTYPINIVAPTITNVSTDGNGFKITGTSKAGSDSFGCMFSNKKYDLTNKSSIKINGVLTGAGYSNFRLVLTKSVVNNYDYANDKSYANLNNGETSFDISEFTGEYYIGIAYQMSGGGQAVPTFTVTSFEMA